MPGKRGGGGGAGYLIGMCHWMGSDFHDWIDYNGAVFALEFYNGIAHFWDLRDQKIHVGNDLKMGIVLLH